MRSGPRKSTPKVVGGKVRKKNSWTQSTDDYYAPSPKEVMLDRKRPGEGYLHILNKHDLYTFLELLPDWNDLAVGLKAIVLAPGSYRYDGYHVPGVVVRRFMGRRPREILRRSREDLRAARRPVRASAKRRLSMQVRRSRRARLPAAPHSSPRTRTPSRSDDDALSKAFESGGVLRRDIRSGACRRDLGSLPEGIPAVTIKARRA